MLPTCWKTSCHIPQPTHSLRSLRARKLPVKHCTLLTRERQLWQHGSGVARPKPHSLQAPTKEEKHHGSSAQPSAVFLVRAAGPSVVFLGRLGREQGSQSLAHRGLLKPDTSPPSCSQTQQGQDTVPWPSVISPVLPTTQSQQRSC